MNNQSRLLRFTFATLLALSIFAALSLHGQTTGGTVNPGYDLFQTDPAATNFMGVPFQGVPLGTYDFGGVIGVQNVGNTDTIVQRFSPIASAPSTTVGTQLIALQLETLAPVNFAGNGLDFYFITLQSVHGGPASSGTITINFPTASPPGGTFSSSFDVFFDVRKGSLNGPIVLSSDLTLTGTNNAWSHDPAPGEILINGVNYQLNGTNTAADFQPVPPVIENHPGMATHTVMPTLESIPEASTYILPALAASGLLFGAFRRAISTRRQS